MRATILGSGTGLPSSRRASPGILLQADGKNILMDSGPGTLRQLAKAGIACRDLDVLIYTHFHPDHTLDLLAFLFAIRNPLQAPKDTGFLIVAPTGFQTWYARAQDMYGKWIVPPEGSMEVRELDPAPQEIALSPRLRLVARPVVHTPQSLGYRWEDHQGRTVVYSGDSEACPALVDLARDAQVCILDCSMPDGRGLPGHMTPGEAGRVAREAHVQTLILTHLYPPCDDVDVTAQCRKEFPGYVVAAEDLMEIRV